MKRLWWMLLSLLLAVTMLGSCGETTGTGEYALRISLEEEYVPDEGRLSFLPWMSEYSRVLSVLEERGVPSEKITETESDGVRRLEVADVSLSEFRYTMKLMLDFYENPEVTAKTGWQLCSCKFWIQDADGENVSDLLYEYQEYQGGDQTEEPSENVLRAEEVWKVYEKDREDWLEKAAGAYQKELGSNNNFRLMKDDTRASQWLLCEVPTSSGQESIPCRVRVMFPPFEIWMEVWDVTKSRGWAY